MLKTTNLTTLWNNFKNLSWWKKVLLSFPFVLIGIILILLASGNVFGPKNVAVDIQKKRHNKQRKDFQIRTKERQNKQNKIDKEIKELDKTIGKYHEDQENIIDRINNADVNELSDIATKIRKRYSKTSTS